MAVMSTHTRRTPARSRRVVALPGHPAPCLPRRLRVEAAHRFFASASLPLVAAILIYLHHNANALAIFQLPVDKILPIDSNFFRFFMLPIALRVPARDLRRADARLARPREQRDFRSIWRARSRGSSTCSER